jgi:hypothetical protein
MGLLRRLALLGSLFMLAPAPLWADTSTLYVWSDSLTLYAAPSFSAAKNGELSYGAEIEPLSPPGPLVAGREAYPPMWGVGEEHFPLHGHWLKLHSKTEPAREGYGFDLYLLPLPVPRCEPGRTSCDPVMAVNGQHCPGDARLCESVEDYSARVFGVLSQDRDDRASFEWTIRYRQDVVLSVLTASDTVVYSKRWTLPMLRSLDQAYIVTRRFYGDSRYLETYDPPRQIHLFRHWDILYLNVFLSVDEKGVVIDWGYVD